MSSGACSATRHVHTRAITGGHPCAAADQNNRIHTIQRKPPRCRSSNPLLALSCKRPYPAQSKRHGKLLLHYRQIHWQVRHRGESQR